MSFFKKKFLKCSSRTVPRTSSLSKNPARHSKFRIIQVNNACYEFRNFVTVFVTSILGSHYQPRLAEIRLRKDFRDEIAQAFFKYSTRKIAQKKLKKPLDFISF